jgi:hypothetical protein
MDQNRRIGPGNPTATPLDGGIGEGEPQPRNEAQSAAVTPRGGQNGRGSPEMMQASRPLRHPLDAWRERLRDHHGR